MSVENAKAFMEKVKEDQEFAKQVAAKKGPAERHEFVKSQGFDFTEEELNQVSSSLSDEELDAVAGGAWLCMSGDCGSGDWSCNADCGGSEWCSGGRTG